MPVAISRTGPAMLLGQGGEGLCERSGSLRPQLAEPGEDLAMLVEEMLQVRHAMRRALADDRVQPLPPLFALEVVQEQGLEFAQELLDLVQIVGMDQRQQQLAELVVFVVDASSRSMPTRGGRALFRSGLEGCGRTCHRRVLLVESRSPPGQENREAPRRCGP